MSLDDLRNRIDNIDRQLVELLNERAQVVIEIGKLKSKTDAPVYAPDREKQVLTKVRKANKGPLPDRTLVAIWRELMSGSFVLERPLRIAYLGPQGSFSHTAALLKFDLSSIPAGSTVQAVELKLTLNQGSVIPSDVFDVNKITSSWTEGNCVSGSGVDWNHKPNSGDDLALWFAQSSSVSVKSSDFPNLTNAVQSWVNNANQNYGLYLVDNSGPNGITFYSREDSTASHRPALVRHRSPSRPAVSGHQRLE